MMIRILEEKDAEEYIRFTNQLFEETDFLLFEPGEREITVEEQENRIRRMHESDHSIIFIAEVQNKIVGHIAAFGGTNKRNKQCASLAIGILQEYANQGLGTKLVEEVDSWAKDRKLHRMELTVMTQNLTAIGLYKKMGFMIEGKRKEALFVNGRYIDEYYMGKLYR